MSGKPYPEGVVRVISLLEQQAKLAAEVAELTQKADRLREAISELSAVRQNLGALLQSMDLEVQGNAGFGGRMGWFLAEMWKLMR